MPPRGRPRLTPEEYEARLAAYCARYGVSASEGLPPFPTGRRETPQHREWIALYKAQRRLTGRESPVTTEARRDYAARQNGRCPVCGEALDGSSGVLDQDRSTRRIRGVLHPRCLRLVRLAEEVGPEALARLRAYLSPSRGPSGPPRGPSRSPR
jgi:hypothetical protein